ncbi:MAG: glycosyltransferase family 9 protein [Parvularculaceae bacterium]
MFGRKQNILIIKTDGLEAFVAAEPAFEAVRTAHPKARISLLTSAGLQRIARAAPFFDQVAALPNMRESEARKEFIRQLKNAKFDCVYDLSGDAAAKKLRSAMGPFRPKWISGDQASRGSRDDDETDGAAPFVEKALAAAKIEPLNRLPDFSWAVAARKDSANMQPSWYGISGTFGMFLPGLDPARRWPAENYARLAQMMARMSIMPVLAGGKELHVFGDEISNDAPELVDLSGKTDHLQLAALAKEAAFFVSDSAEEVHLAVSVGCQGVLIVKAGEEFRAPIGRHVVALTAPGDLGRIEPEFAWRTLENMGLIPSMGPAPRAAAR